MNENLPVPKKSLITEICRCSNIYDCLTAGNSLNPCYKTTTSQNANSVAGFQVPEPWSGNIESSPVLFISDYSTFNVEEEYPLYSWPDHHFENYFNFRFSGGQKQWVKDGLYPLCKGGSHSKRWNRFWSSCKNRALELYRRADVVPGYDFSISSVVRCRAAKNTDTKEAADECVRRYLKKILCLSSASIVVCMGNVASSSVRKVMALQDMSNVYGPIDLKITKRYFAFLPHFNARGPRTLGETLNIVELHSLINFLKSLQP